MSYEILWKGDRLRLGIMITSVTMVLVWVTGHYFNSGVPVHFVRLSVSLFFFSFFLPHIVAFLVLKVYFIICIVFCWGGGGISLDEF